LADNCDVTKETIKNKDIVLHVLKKTPEQREKYSPKLDDIMMNLASKIDMYMCVK